MTDYTRPCAVLMMLVGILFSSQSWAQPAYSAIGELYNEVCSSCHGDSLQGTALGTPLVGVDLKNGSSLEELGRSISEGNPELKMPAWASVLERVQIQSLAIFVLEQRAGFNYDSYNMREEFSIPQGVQSSALHDFELTVLTDDIDPLPYSMTPLPDGSVFIVEKKRGLSIISPAGEKSALITGTPKVWDDSFLPEGLRALDRGKGWMQDVVLHPNYESNGWIYIYFGDRCDDCNEISRAQNQPVGMAKIVRGRIQDGEWIDQQTIWSTGYENYTTNTDLALGGRTTVDDKGYLYFTIGAMNGFFDAEIQDLSKPWGKIHRVHNDGRIPMDNPFVDTPGAIQSIWTFGHRVPQGLEFDEKTGYLWSTEHGQRGGDEINLLNPGRNYGWPLVARGVHYDGSAIEGRLEIEFDIEDIEQPVVDLTPSPAISSLIVYQGGKFPAWDGNLIVGSLKAQALYRFDVANIASVNKEILVHGIGRIRDVEVSADSSILVLVENAEGSMILKVSPVGPVKRSPQVEATEPI